MHRPLIWFSAAFAAGCGFALFDVSIPIIATAVILAVCVGVGKWIKRLLPVCVLIAGLVCGVSYTVAYHQYITEPIADLAGQSKYLTVTVTDFATQYEENQRVEVRISGEDVGCEKDFKTLIYLPLTEQQLVPGDEVSGKVEFYISGLREGFDRETYYRSQGYFVLASVNNDLTIEVKSPEKRPLSYYPKQFAQNLRNVFEEMGTERQSAFWSALITGDRSGLTTSDTDHLRKAGLSHVIAVSGLHVGFLISFLMMFFGRKVGTAFGIPVLIAFYCMVGWSPSVVRACIMYGIMLLSFWLRRQSDSMNSLFAALLLILVVLPDALMSVGLQLSFVSTFGILCLSSRIQSAFALPKKAPKLLKRIYQVLIGSIACTAGSTLLTIPILLYHFGYISVFSVLSNLLALWAISLVFPMAAIGGMAGLFSPSAADIILIPARWLTDYILWVCDWTAGLPYGILNSEDNTDFYLSIAFCVLTVLLIRKGKRWMTATAVPLMFVILIGFSVWRGMEAENDLRVSVLTEGGGQAIIVSCGEQTALIDCSGSGYHNAAQDVASYLDWYGVDSLDLVVLTSVDLTHARNIVQLLNMVTVEHVILPAENRENKDPYPQLIETLETKQISYEKLAPETETDIGDASLGLSVLGTVPRKLAVRIHSEDMDVLTVHAFTQKMLITLTDAQEITCDTLIVSGSFSEDTENMKTLLDRMKPNNIVLLNVWKSGTEWYNIPITNPYYTGQIDWKSIRD